MRRRWIRPAMATLLCMVVGGPLVHAQSVRAEAFGELGHVGEFGSSAGQFTYPTDLAVDTENNDVYVLDEPGAETPGMGPESFRVQMFKPPLTPHEAPSGQVEIPTPVNGEGFPSFVTNIAVDPALHRLYVLKATLAPCEEFEEYVGLEIDAYSTEPEPGTGLLPPAGNVETDGEKGVFYKFPAIRTCEASGALLFPHGLAVDPTTHSLILNGRDEQGSTMIERLTTVSPYATGAPGGAFDDANGDVVKDGSGASGVAVGPDEEIYFVAHNLLAGEPAGELPGVAELTTTGLDTLEDPGVSVIAKNHGEASGELQLTGGKESVGAFGPGAQVAVSPDGKTVYAVEVSQLQASEAGSYEIRAISTADGSQQVAFGGGSTSCRITSASNAVAAGGDGIVYALDEGGTVFKGGKHEPTPFGFNLIEFGPDGSGCPTPSASFEINGNSESGSPVVVSKGAPVEFDAANSELNGEEPVELQWDLDGSGQFATKIMGTPADLTVMHEYFEPGLYTVGLKLLLKNNGSYGNPPLAAREIEVVAPPPIASFEASTLNPKPGEAVAFNASDSLDPAGGECQAGHGCAGTHTLSSYEWSFGDGTSETTNKDEFARSFSNTSSQPRSETVKLVVTNKEGIKSAASTQALTIQGTPENHQEAPKEPSKTTLPPTTTTPVVTPPPAKKTPTKAEKLAHALKACKKLKKSKRSICEKQARQKYGSKPKSSKKTHRKK
jgi:hypothetical protein